MDKHSVPRPREAILAQEGWKVLLPGVWELLRLNRTVILILVWEGWLGPCHWETSPGPAQLLNLYTLR